MGLSANKCVVGWGKLSDLDPVIKQMKTIITIKKIKQTKCPSLPQLIIGT